ncbi:MAG: hypothetical protein ACD_19C00015G0018 [uncultured bacterium]|nr:MAG: hypothetical protein ACD_19C00015G0018 [uncultured bacterium]
MATLAAFCKAERVTFTGSTIPILVIDPNSEVKALYPKSLSFEASIFFTTAVSSSPAFFASHLIGSSKASYTISPPNFSSPTNFKFFITFLALKNAVSPPGTIPSSTAAFVAPTASFTLSFFSFNSISVAAPTLITATPPDNLASLSCNFSLSKSESVVLI